MEELDATRLEAGVVVPLLSPDSLSLTSSAGAGSSEALCFGVVTGEGEGSVTPVEGRLVTDVSGVDAGAGDRKPDDMESDDTERVLYAI